MIYRNVAALIEGQEPVTMQPGASVQEAAERMAEQHIGAIALMESDRLVGLFTERDLLNRVVAKGLSPRDLAVGDVMTRDPVTVDAEAALVHCLDTMLEHQFRHLPVLDGERLVGVLSCRDIPVNYWNMRERWVAAHNQPQEAAA